MIGLTGATGRLGQAILKQTNALPFGRTIPNSKVSVLIHAAAPPPTGTTATFSTYNLAIRQYCNRHKPRIINIGSCWQILQGTCQDTDYTKVKRRQADLFAEATHVIPYWVFGGGRGFISDITTAIQRGTSIPAAGEQPRDFIHVDDVATDVLNAIDLPAGHTIASCTTIPTRPVDILLHLGWEPNINEPQPTATLRYPHPTISQPTRNVYQYIHDHQ